MPSAAKDAYSDFGGFVIYRPNPPFQGRNGATKGCFYDTDVCSFVVSNAAGMRLYQ